MINKERTAYEKTTIYRFCFDISDFLYGGCTGENTKDSDTLVLALRSGTYSEVIRECLSDFEKEHNVTCKILEFSEDELHSILLNDSASGTGEFALCMLDSSWFAEFTANEMLLNLSDYGYSFDDDIIPATTGVCMKDGGIYMAPFYGNVTVMLYNRALLEKAGLSDRGIKTLDDVTVLCEKARESGKKGFLYRGDTENNIVVDFLPILRAFGGWVVDDNNKPTVNTPEFAAALKYYLSLVQTGGAQEKEDLIVSIDKEEAAAGVGWPGWYTPEANSSAYYCAVPGKVSDDSEQYNSNIYGIWSLGIPANSPHSEMAVELLKYLMDVDVQKASVEHGGVPCRYSVLKDSEVLKQHPYYEAICDALENGIYRPAIEEWPDFYMILGQQMGEILKGKISVEDGLLVAQETLEDLLE